MKRMSKLQTPFHELDFWLWFSLCGRSLNGVLCSKLRELWFSSILLQAMMAGDGMELSRCTIIFQNCALRSSTLQEQ